MFWLLVSQVSQEFIMYQRMTLDFWSPPASTSVCWSVRCALPCCLCPLYQLRKIPSPWHLDLPPFVSLNHSMPRCRFTVG